MQGYCTRMIIISTRRSYSSVVLGVVILSFCPSVCHTRALWLIQITSTSDIFIPHFNYSKHVVKKRTFQVAIN